MINLDNFPSFFIANWKLNGNFAFLKDYFTKLKSGSKNAIVICTPDIYLNFQEKKSENIFCGAQDVSKFDEGAYTGETSVNMLVDVGIDFCLVGHSERRQYFNESHSVLRNKLSQALSNNLKVIFCCGENINQRDNNEFLDVIYNQLSSTVFNLSATDFSKIIIAYEPIWAIGTGKNATSDQAQKMHNYIRTIVFEKYGNEAANNVSILYGGSCKPSNAKSIFSQIDIDGGLIGGASLKSDDFISIINSI